MVTERDLHVLTSSENNVKHNSWPYPPDLEAIMSVQGESYEIHKAHHCATPKCPREDRISTKPEIRPIYIGIARTCGEQVVIAGE